MKRHIWYLLVLMTSTASQAQKLSAKDAVELALKNSLGIQIAKNNLGIAGINNSCGIAGGLPTVGASLTDLGQLTSGRENYSISSNDVVINDQRSNTLTASLSGSVLLYNGQRVVTAKKRLGVIESQAQQQLGSRALLIIYNVLLTKIIKYSIYTRDYNLHLRKSTVNPNKCFEIELKFSVKFAGLRKILLVCDNRTR